MNQGLDARLDVVREQFSLAIDLTIEPGETVALLGPNGAGKSTTVNALTGLVPLDAGSIRLGGRLLDDVAAGVRLETRHRRIGVVFQDYLLFEHLRVLDNVAFGPASTGLRNRDARRRARRWIEMLDLESLVDRRPSELSGGQAQRVAIARALASEPDLLLLDEPLAALDVETRTSLRRTLQSVLDDFAGPRLLITHDPTDAFLLAGRLDILEGGTITQRGTAAEIRRTPATAYAAALSGTNLLRGTKVGSAVTLADGLPVIQTADDHLAGEVLVTISPSAITVHAEQPRGSARNRWATTVTSVESLGSFVRLTVVEPVPLGIDVTPASVAAMNLKPGQAIWLSVKATEVAVNPA